MKTNENKLSHLLKIACENGWKKDELLPFNYTVNAEWCVLEDLMSDEGWKFYSLNDLVSNWEEGEVCFIEALWIGYAKQINSEGSPITCRDLILRNWVLKPTSKRLEFLFNTFSHLLQ